MNEEHKEKMKRIAELKKEDIGHSEEDVKINFIVPLLKALGHNQLDFEHGRTDIFIKKGLPQFAELLIETKRYDKDLTQHLQQLERYCNEKRPLLGIIANGTEIRIYSYWWRYRASFQDHLIYLINRGDLKDERTIQTIENILSRDSLKSGKAREHVNEREEEIKLAEAKIKVIEEKAKDDEGEIKVKIDELNQKIHEIENRISHAEKKLNGIETRKKEQIEEIWSNLGLSQPTVSKPATTAKVHRPTSGASYREKYQKQLDNPDSMASKIMRYVQERGEVRYKELEEVIVNKWRYKKSGSIGACLTVLEQEKYIQIEGRGDHKVLRAIKE